VAGGGFLAFGFEGTYTGRFGLAGCRGGGWLAQAVNRAVATASNRASRKGRPNGRMQKGIIVNRLSERI